MSLHCACLHTPSPRAYSYNNLASTCQGLAALIGLNMLEHAYPEGLPRDWHDPAKLHVQLEAMRLAFAAAFAFNSDPEHVEVPLDVLLSKEYAAAQWAAHFSADKVLRVVDHVVLTEYVIVFVGAGQPMICDAATCICDDWCC